MLSSSGITSEDIISTGITKDEKFLNMAMLPEVYSDIFIERGRLTNSPSGEIRNFVIGDRGSGIQLLLDKNGTLTVTGNIIAYGSPSDITLKTIKSKVDNAVEKVSKLNGYYFDWKEVNSLTNIKEDIGVIAQEVQQIFPELARTNEDGFMSVRYQGLIAVIIEAIKEQQKQIEELKAKLN